jgi:hypothetical protein
VDKEALKESAVNNLTSDQVCLMKLVTQPYDSGRGLTFTVDLINFNKTMQHLLEKGPAQAIKQRLDGHTRLWNCHICTKSMINLFKKTGFAAPPNSELPGLSLFVIQPTAISLSDGESELLLGMEDNDQIDTVLPREKYYIPTTFSEMRRQIKGFVDFLEILAEGICFLSSGMTYALVQVDKYTGHLERMGAQDPYFYAKFLSRLDRINFLLINGVREIVETAAPGVPTQIPMALLTKQNSRIDKIFDSIDLQEFSCHLPLAIQAAAGAGGAINAGGGGGGGGDGGGGNNGGGGPGTVTGKKRAKAWFSTKPPDDNSRQWEIPVGKAFIDFFGTDTKGKANKAMLASIRVLHHKFNDTRNKDVKKKREKKPTSPCPKYISTGTCEEANCKFSHFAKSKAKKLMADDEAKGLAAVKLIDEACRKIYL